MTECKQLVEIVSHITVQNTKLILGKPSFKYENHIKDGLNIALEKVPSN